MRVWFNIWDQWRPQIWTNPSTWSNATWSVIQQNTIDWAVSNTWSMVSHPQHLWPHRRRRVNPVAAWLRCRYHRDASAEWEVYCGDEYWGVLLPDQCPSERCWRVSQDASECCGLWNSIRSPEEVSDIWKKRAFDNICNFLKGTIQHTCSLYALIGQVSVARSICLHNWCNPTNAFMSKHVSCLLSLLGWFITSHHYL